MTSTSSKQLELLIEAHLDGEAIEIPPSQRADWLRPAQYGGVVGSGSLSPDTIAV